MPLVYVIIIVATVASMLIMARFYFTNARRMTSYTTGEVVSAEEKVIIENDRRRVETHVLIQYTVHGKQLSITRTVPGGRSRAYPAGLTVPIRYNPAEPEMADLAARN